HVAGTNLDQGASLVGQSVFYGAHRSPVVGPVPPRLDGPHRRLFEISCLVSTAPGLRHRGGENPAIGIGGRLRRRHRLQTFKRHSVTRRGNSRFPWPRFFRDKRRGDADLKGVSASYARGRQECNARWLLKSSPTTFGGAFFERP